jgi:hypothetical protein
VITRAPDYAARANLGHSSNFAMTSHNITNRPQCIIGTQIYGRARSPGAVLIEVRRATVGSLRCRAGQSPRRYNRR